MIIIAFIVLADHYQLIIVTKQYFLVIFSFFQNLFSIYQCFLTEMAIPQGQGRHHSKGSKHWFKSSVVGDRLWKSQKGGTEVNVNHWSRVYTTKALIDHAVAKFTYKTHIIKSYRFGNFLREALSHLHHPTTA